MSQQVLKETLIVSLLTLISRLLGFLRDMCIANLFGVSFATDAFFVAFKLPNLFRRLFTEGALNHVLVPVLTQYQQQSHNNIRQFIAKLAGKLSVYLFLLMLMGLLFAPVFVKLLAFGFAETEYLLAIDLLRICLPYLFFISLTALAGCVFNAYQRFALTALTPIMLNMVLIISALVLSPYFAEPIYALAWGVGLAGLIQVLIQLPALKQLNLLVLPRVDWHCTEVNRLLSAILPAILSISVTHLNILIDSLIASFLPTGSISWLYYSERLVEFPIGILSMAVGTVILPKLARCHAQAQTLAFKQALNWGIQLIVLIAVPATLGLWFLAEPLLSTLFQYQHFTQYDVESSAQSLRAYSVGLSAYMLIRLLVSAFSARHDLTTPIRYSYYALAVSLALNVLAIPFSHAGLALATSLGALFNAGLLLWRLVKERILIFTADWRVFGLRLVLANSALSALLYHGVRVEQWYSWQAEERALQLAIWLILGIGCYFLVLCLSGWRWTQQIKFDAM